MGQVFRIDRSDGITGSRYGGRLARVMEQPMSQYEPSGPYPQYPPYPPYPQYQPPPWEGPPPTAIRYARNLIYTFIALNLVRLVVWIFDDRHADAPGGGGADLPTIVLVAIGMISAVVGSAMWVVAVIFVLRAARWARILIVGLCGAAVLGLLWQVVGYSFLEPEDRPTSELLVIDIVSAVLIAIATGLLWTRETSRFFKSSG